MDRKKYALIIITAIIGIVFFSVLLFSKIDFRKLTTDSGFDSSWDSGGSSWDSSSSWSSSSSSESSSSSSSDAPPWVIITAIVITILVILYDVHSANYRITNLNY